MTPLSIYLDIKKTLSLARGVQNLNFSPMYFPFAVKLSEN